MPVLKNPKHEQFARNRSNGMGVADAYAAAGYPLSPSAASQLNARPEVRDRIAELDEERHRSFDQAPTDEDGEAGSVEEYDTSPEGLIKELFSNLRRAQREGNIGAANKAVELIAELRGYLKKGASDALNGKDQPKATQAPESPRININDLRDAVDAISGGLQSLTHKTP